MKPLGQRPVGRHTRSLYEEKKERKKEGTNERQTAKRGEGKEEIMKLGKNDGMRS